MSWIGVITGDIVNSSKILEAGQRDKLLEVIHRTIEDIKQSYDGIEIKIDIFRGDSFQILVNYSFDTLDVAIMLRANLIANSTENIRWDARLGIGIGEGEYLADRVSESDGEAFHLSGKAFDNLKKGSNMSILTPDKNFNHELEVSTAFADDIISNWTTAQANIVYQIDINLNITQKQLAETMNIKPQTLSKHIAASKGGLILEYRKRFLDQTIALEDLITETNNKRP